MVVIIHANYKTRGIYHKLFTFQFPFHLFFVPLFRRWKSGAQSFSPEKIIHPCRKRDFSSAAAFIASSHRRVYVRVCRDRQARKIWISKLAYEVIFRLHQKKSPSSEIFKFNDIKRQAAWAEQKEFAFWRNKRTNPLRPPKAFLSAGTSEAKRLFENEIMRTNKKEIPGMRMGAVGEWCAST